MPTLNLYVNPILTQADLQDISSIFYERSYGHDKDTKHGFILFPKAPQEVKELIASASYFLCHRENGRITEFLIAHSQASLPALVKEFDVSQELKAFEPYIVVYLVARSKAGKYHAFNDLYAKLSELAQRDGYSAIILDILAEPIKSEHSFKRHLEVGFTELGLSAGHSHPALGDLRFAFLAKRLN